MTGRARAAAACAAALILLGTVAVRGQGSEAAEILGRFLQHRESMRGYVWESRTEVTVDGEPRGVELFRVDHDDAGGLRRTLIESQEPERTGGPIRRIKRNRADRRTEQTVGALLDLIGSYTGLESRRLRSTFSGTGLLEGHGPTEGLARLRAKNVHRQGDSMDIWFDRATRKLRTFEIFTSIEGEPVRVKAEFQATENGTVFVARTRIETELKEKRLVMTIENFNLERLAGED